MPKLALDYITHQSLYVMFLSCSISLSSFCCRILFVVSLPTASFFCASLFACFFNAMEIKSALAKVAVMII